MNIGLSVLLLIFACLGQVVFSKDLIHFKSSGELGASRTGYVVIGDHEYFINDQTAMAYDAVKSCNDLGMKLFCPSTEEKHVLITQYLADHGYTGWYWTCGQLISGSWVWTGEGRELIYSSWHAGEPNYTGQVSDVCVSQLDGEFFDEPCYYANSFICE